jgi:hypothetical protein
MRARHTDAKQQVRLAARIVAGGTRDSARCGDCIAIPRAQFESGSHMPKM